MLSCPPARSGSDGASEAAILLSARLRPMGCAGTRFLKEAKVAGGLSNPPIVFQPRNISCLAPPPWRHRDLPARGRQLVIVCFALSTAKQKPVNEPAKACLSRHSPDGGPSEAEIAAAGFLLQDGPVAVGCGCASERIGSGRDPNDRQVSVIKTQLSRCFVDMRNAERFTRLM
jgi:hypothetical protein